MARVSDDPPALLIDFGGVITESVHEAFERACLAYGVDPQGFIGEVFAAQHSDDSPFALIESGRIGLDEFRQRLAAVLARHSHRSVDAAAWWNDVQQTTGHVDPLMADALQNLFDRGIQTVLVSNSWGPRETYPWGMLPEFTAVLLSGEVGLRKPDPNIYRLAHRHIGRDARECLFIDDVAVNLAPARELGMSVYLHRRRDETLAELRRVYG